MATADDRMITFRLIATGAAELKGFLSLEPMGGVDGAATTFFFELKCTQCGEATGKDVCLRPADAQMVIHHPNPCSYRVRRSSAGRYVRHHCYPRCYNTAHLVRRCKACGCLGSVELVPSGGLLSTGSSHVMATLECMGYTPLSFSPGPNWTLATMTGAEFEVGLVGDTFLGRDDCINDNIIIKGVKFIFKEA